MRWQVCGVCVVLMAIGFVLPFRLLASEEETPEWLKRVEFSVQCETDQEPVFYFQMVQPLYQSEDSTVFYQPRVSLKRGNFTYNIGVGYRRLVDEGLLLGINVFGDYEDFHEHGRLGVGLEALTQIWEARLNGYFGITSKRVVEESDTATVYERVADGLDFELGAPVPYLPWLKVYASGFWYDFDKFSDKKGWKSRLEARLSDALVLEFYTWDDNKGEQEYGGRLRCNIAFDTLGDLAKIFTAAQQAFPKKDLSKQMLVPVERNFDIVVEKWVETASMTIEVGRGN